LTTPTLSDRRSQPADGATEPRGSELARFFAYARDVLAIIDRGGRVLLVSQSVERVLGYPVDEIIGRRFLPWVHPEDHPRLKTELRAVLAERSLADLDARTLHADGAWVPMRWSLAVGRGRRVYAVGRDLSEAALHRDALLREQMAGLRLRTAMELHDGILQTLTGASLQIATARRLVHTDPAAAEEVLEALGQSVAARSPERLHPTRRQRKLRGLCIRRAS